MLTLPGSHCDAVRIRRKYTIINYPNRIKSQFCNCGCSITKNIFAINSTVANKTESAYYVDIVNGQLLFGNVICTPELICLHLKKKYCVISPSIIKNVKNVDKAPMIINGTKAFNVFVCKYYIIIIINDIILTV